MEKQVQDDAKYAAHLQQLEYVGLGAHVEDDSLHTFSDLEAAPPRRTSYPPPSIDVDTPPRASRPGRFNPAPSSLYAQQHDEEDDVQVLLGVRPHESDVQVIDDDDDEDMRRAIAASLQTAPPQSGASRQPPAKRRPQPPQPHRPNTRQSSGLQLHQQHDFMAAIQRAVLPDSSYHGGAMAYHGGARGVSFGGSHRGSYGGFPGGFHGGSFEDSYSGVGGHFDDDSEYYGGGAFGMPYGHYTRAAARTAVDDPIGSYEQLSSLPDVPTPLSASARESKTILQRLSETDAQKISKDECPICLTNFSAGERVRRLPCLHLFHQHCIDEYFKTKHDCPICHVDVN